MLRYWEVVDDNGVIVAAGLGDTKHARGRNSQREDVEKPLRQHQKGVCQTPLEEESPEEG